MLDSELIESFFLKSLNKMGTVHTGIQVKDEDRRLVPAYFPPDYNILLPTFENIEKNLTRRVLHPVFKDFHEKLSTLLHCISCHYQRIRVPKQSTKPAIFFWIFFWTQITIYWDLDSGKLVGSFGEILEKIHSKWHFNPFWPMRLSMKWKFSFDTMFIKYPLQYKTLSTEIMMTEIEPVV